MSQADRIVSAVSDAMFHVLSSEQSYPAAAQRVVDAFVALRVAHNRRVRELRETRDYVSAALVPEYDEMIRREMALANEAADTADAIAIALQRI